VNYAARLSDIRLALSRAAIRLISWSKPHAEVRREPRLPNVRMENYRLLLAFIKERKAKIYPSFPFPFPLPFFYFNDIFFGFNTVLIARSKNSINSLG